MWWLLSLLAALAASDSETRGRGDCVVESSPTEQTYRSRDGSSFFRFRFTPVADGIRIHILEFPNPQRGSCHVLTNNDTPYICWSRAIRSIEEAKAVAVMWAEATLVYQRPGQAF